MISYLDAFGLAFGGRGERFAVLVFGGEELAFGGLFQVQTRLGLVDSAEGGGGGETVVGRRIVVVRIG